VDPSEAVKGRVALVCGSLQPGGAERQVANTLIGLSQAKQVESVSLLCDHLQSGTPEQYDFYLPLARQSGCEIRQISNYIASGQEKLPDRFRAVTHRIRLDLIADVANLYFEFKRLKPEIVHAWLDWSNIRAGLAASLAGVPRIILSGRNLSPRHFALNDDYYFPSYQALVEQKRKIVFLNNSLAGANDYAHWLGLSQEDVTVIRNAAQFSESDRPTPEQTTSLRETLGIPSAAVVIGGMFRFSPEKRPLLWLEAMAAVSCELPDAFFVLFGQGEMLPEMQKAAERLKIDHKLQFAGLVQPSFKGLSACSLILLTSFGEGTPNVLLEAQWLGLPVVTTDAGGAAEALMDGVTGAVCKSDEPQEIAAAVLRIVRDSAFRRQAAEAGPEFIQGVYGADRMIQETLAAYGLTAASKWGTQ